MLLNRIRSGLVAARARPDHPGSGRGRLARRSWWSPLVGVIVGIAVLACTGDSVEHVSLAELVAEQDAYDGSLVIAEGTVQTYDQPRHYWIEDIEQHRVELFPHELVEDLVGQRIRVTGRFTFRDDRGRGIDVDDLEVLNGPPTALPSAFAAGRGLPGLAGVVGVL